MNRIEEILNSTDGMQRAEANPYLYTRIKANMANSPSATSWELVARFLTRPAVAIITVFMFLAVNVSVIVKEREDKAMAVQQFLQQSSSTESDFAIQVQSNFSADLSSE